MAKSMDSDSHASITLLCQVQVTASRDGPRVCSPATVAIDRRLSESIDFHDGLVLVRKYDSNCHKPQQPLLFHSHTLPPPLREEAAEPESTPHLGLPTLGVSSVTSDQFGLPHGTLVELSTSGPVWLTSVVLVAEPGTCKLLAAAVADAITSNGAVLVHRGHSLTLASSFVVVQFCLPTIQGLIGPSSRVVVVESSSVEGKSPTLIEPPSQFHEQPPPLLHSFASRMDIRQSELQMRVVVGANPASTETEHDLFAPAASQWRRSRSFAPLQVCDELAGVDAVDPSRVLYLPNEIALIHGFVSGEWVKFTRPNTFCGSGQVFVVPRSCGRKLSCPVLSDTLWQQLVARCSDGTWNITRCEAPIAATRVWLAQVMCPGGGGSDASFAAAMVELFTMPRVLSVGDILRIDTEGYTGYAKITNLSAEMDNATPESIPDHGFVVSSSTAVLEVTGVSSRVLPSIDNAVLSETGKAMAQIISRQIPHVDALKGRETSPHSTLLLGSRGAGKHFWVKNLATAHGYHLHSVSCHDLNGDTAKGTVQKLEEALQTANDCSPCVLLLEHVHALAPADSHDGGGASTPPNSAAIRIAHVLRRLVTIEAHIDDTRLPLGPVWLVGTTHMTEDALADDLADCFVHRIEIEAPDEAARASYLESAWERVISDPTVDPESIAKDTAGLSPRDLDVLLRLAQQAAYTRVATCDRTLSHAAFSGIGVVVCAEDVECALSGVKAEQTRAIGVPTIPNVSWADVGGLASAKKDILDTVQVPLEHPELFSTGLRRSGVLLYGPPGTGKTLLAKAVATECALNFFSVKGPELINMYIGQSEANIRAVFERARAARPCVVFFDELDSLAPNRGRSGDSGGVMDRIVSQLLAELDGLHSGNDVFIIGATNRPDLLDTALLRPGRLDKLIYLGMPDRANQERILRAQTRKFSLAADVNLTQAVECLPPNLTGADLYALSADAMMCAIRRTIETAEPSLTEDENTDALTGPVTVEQVDLARAIANLKPSVSQAELQHYEDLHRQFNAMREA